jgi:hypothetical protein
MGASLIGAIEQLLKLGNLTMEEKHRYDDNLLKLKLQWNKAYDALETDDGSDILLDDITDELCLVLDAVVETVRAKNA